MRRTFLSYAREDLASAQRLNDDLSSIGVAMWFDEHSLRAGNPWKALIAEQIRKSRFFLALISRSSVNKRGYVQKEVREALAYAEELPPGDDFIIPIRLDNSIPRHRALHDFNWVDLFPDYETGLTRLVKRIAPRRIPRLQQLSLARAAAPRGTSELHSDRVRQSVC